jgi:KaiC/GvpD/RAD55 family RecA-like ATPase
MLSLSLAMAMATGGSVVPWKSEQAYRVLYIDGEMHEEDVKDRLETLRDTGAVTLGNATLLADNLVFVNRQGQQADTVFFDLTSEEGRAAILQAAEKLEADVVILDNFTTLSEGLEDENAATSFKKIQSFLLSTKQRNLTTILIHHARKDGNALRGSASIEVTFESVLELRKPKLPRMDAASFVPVFGKFRQKRSEALLPRQWSLTETGWQIDDEIVQDGDSAVVLCVRSRKFVSQQEIAQHLVMSKGTVSKQLTAAKLAKQITDKEISECFSDARQLRDHPGDAEEGAEGMDGQDDDADY